MNVSGNESQIDLFLEHVKRSAARTMEDRSNDGWLTNENLVHTIVKRSRSGMSSSDDGTGQSTDDVGDLAVRDVADLLRIQYAIITGGKTENGCPIITFPDIGNFSALGDLEYQSLMLYLTSVPSMQEADVGFVLVIDRRNDRWNSVKPTLLKLSGYFPGLVQAVYVLRPSGLIKKTISDVLNKLFKEDFKFKVTVCNSLEELHGFIDKSQLTPDLGGTIQYNHAEWIRQREELEAFSEEMKEVSAKLDCFTKKMQETEVPGDAEAIQELLTLQQTEYGTLKEKILNAAKHGESLLEIFRKSQSTDDDVNQLPQTDKLGNVAAVERLLVQLEETERTFCEFQSEHFQKLKLWLDRRIFERDVAELESKFEQHLKTVNEMVEVGENASRVETLIKETNAWQKLCMADIDRAEEVILNGQRLLKTKQYSAEEVLQLECDKLKKLCIILTERIDHRLDTLAKHRELQEQIDKANAWCATGIELLSSQQIEKAPGDSDLAQKSISEINGFLSTAESLQLNCPKKLFKDNITPETKALVTQVVHRIADVTSMCDKRLASLKLLTKNRQRPVQAVTPEPGVPLQPSHGAPVLNKLKILKKANTVAKLEDPWNQLKSSQNIDKDIPTGDPQVLKSKREHILAELLETEQVYVNELHSILKGYKEEMESPEMKPLLPSELIGKADILFGNLDEIYAFHNDLFLKDLQNCITTTELVALCFTHRKNEFYKLYSTYCQNSPKSEQLRQMVGERNFFFGACQIKLGHKLPLAAYLLKPIQRITKYQLLLKDLLRNSEIPKCRSQLQEALKCMLVVLKCVNDSMHQIAITGFRGDLSDQGELLMQGSFSVWTESKKIRELRLTPMHRHIFLYRKAILFCKKENKENNKATYHFKRYLQMSQIGLTESVKGDPRKFEIWLQGRQQVHTIQASTVEQKLVWVQQIKEVLLEQLAELRGANMRQYSLNKTPFFHRTLRQTTSWESQSSMDSCAGSNNRAFSCDETNSPHIQPLIESEEESSDQSNSEDEDTFNEQVPGTRYIVLADYRSQGHNEISLQEGTLVEILRIGCGGWWYVKLLDHYFQGQPIEGYAWVTLATNDSYSLGALVLAHSLRKSNTAYKLVVLITPTVSQIMVEQLQTVFDLVEIVDPINSNDDTRLALMKRPELGVTFTKIHCWRLAQFEKCVFLDADTFVVRNCDELFEREEFSAAPDVGWPDCFNSGVFVYKPSIETFNELIGFALREGSFDGGDQGLLNQFFSDWATEDIKKHLPFVYNLTSVAVYSYVPAFRHYGAETRIVHFIGTEKPWLQCLDPATRTVIPTPGSEHLAPFLQQWWDLFCEKVHPILKKNQENNNDGMHLPVEVCSNTPVALTSDEPQPPRLTEPCLQYIEKDDYRQHNLPYKPFVVRGSSGELLNLDFLLASVVLPENLEEQQRQDDEELEEKDRKSVELQEEVNSKSKLQKEEANSTPDKIDEIKLDIVDDKVEEKEKKVLTPKDPFDYSTFFPDEKCVHNYLEQNLMAYQPYESFHQNSEPKNIPLPRFLVIPEDDQRQKGNVKTMEYQPAPEPPPPPSTSPSPSPSLSSSPILSLSPSPSPASVITTATTATTTTTTVASQEKSIDVQRQPTPPPKERHELLKSKSMTFIPKDIIPTDISSLPQRSIWSSQPNVNVDLNRKYSMPKLKPILPRQNSKSIQSPIPKITLYTEFLMSADYKDPVDLPKDKVGFVETELRRSKSETDLKVKFGPLPYTKSPEVEVREPKKPPLRQLDNDTYDLTRCKRQIGNKPRDHKKENITPKISTPSNPKTSTLIKKRKSKEISPGDKKKEKPIKKERKEHHKKNENLDEILKRLWEFSKHYQHYFGVNAQNEITEKPIQSDFKEFRNFVKDQKQTTQKGLLNIKDIMTEKLDDMKIKNGNTKCITESEVPKIVNGVNKAIDKNTKVTSNIEVKVQSEKCTPIKDAKIPMQSPDRCKIRNKKQSTLALEKIELGETVPRRLTLSENVQTDHNGIKTSENDINRYVGNVDRDYIAAKFQGAISRENNIIQNGWKSQTDIIATQCLKESITDKETFTQNEKNNNSVPEIGNECRSFSIASVKSPKQPDISEKIGENSKLTTNIKTLLESKVSTGSLKQAGKISVVNLSELRSQDLEMTAPNMQTSAAQSFLITENTDDSEKDAVMVTRTNSTNNENSKQQEDEKMKKSSLEKVEGLSEFVKTQTRSDSSEKILSAVNKEVENVELNSAVLVNNIQEKAKMQSQTSSKKLTTLEEYTAPSYYQIFTVGGTSGEVSTVAAGKIPEGSETLLVQDTVPLEISSLRASVEESMPKEMLMISSRQENIKVHEESNKQSKGNIVSSVSGKQTEQVPQTSDIEESILKPDEILCVPDFDTPRSSRILMPNPKPLINATFQALTSSPITVPRKARIQRKPYENGTKHKSQVGKKTSKTGNIKNTPGIAGAIAKLKLKGSGEAGDSNEGLAAQEEYIRRKNWETGNIDYMGKDSFENIWSKICQTLEGKELDKAIENTQSLMTISTEEKTKTKGAAGAEDPVSLSMILDKCPEFIDALPSEPVTGPVEDDEIIFLKPETKQKCLTNIREEEENGAASEGIGLSDTLTSNKLLELVKTSDEVGNTSTVTPTQLHLDKKLSEKSKSNEERHVVAQTPTPQAQEILKATVPSRLAEQVNEPIKQEAPINENLKTQLETATEKKSEPECTTVAVHQPLFIPGAPCENREPAKTPAQKIAEKKFQQKSETSTEPIPLPAPDSPTGTECKTVAIPHSPIIPALNNEKQRSVKIIAEPALSSETPSEITSAKTSSKEETQKKGVFSKLLEMVGVAPKTEEVSKCVFYDLQETTEKSENPEIQLSTEVQEVKESQSVMREDDFKTQKLEKIPHSRPENDSRVEQTATIKGTNQTSTESKEEPKHLIPVTEKPSNEVAKKAPDSGKSGQTSKQKPARNASPKSSAQVSKNKSPSPLTIPQTPPETELTMATPTPPPDPPKRRNSALLKVDESIPITPPVPEPQKVSAEPVKSRVDDMIEKAKTKVENILQDRGSVETETSENSELIKTMKLIMGAEEQPETEELKVTSEEERQRHKGEIVSSKLSDQILKAIPPPRRKTISESKSEASGSSGAIPKATTSPGEKPKHKPSSIPVPPPRNKGKPSTPGSSKGKTKK